MIMSGLSRINQGLRDGKNPGIVVEDWNDHSKRTRAIEKITSEAVQNARVLWQESLEREAKAMASNVLRDFIDEHNIVLPPGVDPLHVFTGTPEPDPTPPVEFRE